MTEWLTPVIHNLTLFMFGNTLTHKSKFDPTLSVISTFCRIHFNHTAKVNFMEAIVYQRTIVSEFSCSFRDFCGIHLAQ